MDSKQIEDALRVLHPPEAWGFFTEMANALWIDSYRRFDVYAVAYWKSLKYERRVYEIKISRGDWRREMNEPRKRMEALAKSNTFYFAAPKGMIRLDELPEECGLIEVDGDRARIRRKAPWRECEQPGWNFFLTIARRASQAEARMEKIEKLLSKHKDKNNPYWKVFYHAEQLSKVDDLSKHPRLCEKCDAPPDRLSFGLTTATPEERMENWRRWSVWQTALSERDKLRQAIDNVKNKDG